MKSSIGGKISISGDLGSGKTTVSKLVAKKLNFEHYSTGDIQRKLAAENNMTTLEFNRLSDTKAQIDKLIDGKTTEMANSTKNLVFDSRMAWFFIPNSFSVRLVIDEKIGARRIMNAERGSVEEYKDLDEAIEKIKERKTSEKTRFLKKYNVNLLNFENYDLIIDTSYISPEEATELLIEKYNLWLSSQKFHPIWINPKNLFPTQNIRDINPSKLQKMTRTLSESGFDKKHPIEMFSCDEKLFIYKGHHRVAGAILNDLRLVPTNLITNESPLFNVGGTSIDCYVKTSCEIHTLYDWEECFNFSYSNYPNFLL